MAEEESGKRQFFIGFENENLMLNEASRLGILKEKKAKTLAKEEDRNRKRKEQEAYLEKKLIKAEKRKPFKEAQKSQYEGGNIETILNQADKSRIILSIFSNLKLGDLVTFQKTLSPSPENNKSTTLVTYLG